ncbi:MAG: ISLre2 family transposase [Leptolyngbyaceae cyanobacterium MO_188.B28]|nr:ISLre2 family transposase [Leptolyngbyaceae cyanobacterium MO_188.B28]
MTIPATLDLNQAMAAFKQSILPLLIVGDIASWDGPVLKEREESIRQATLVLAGQIIALLMHQLSEHPDSQREAKKRTQSSRGFMAASQGKRRLTVLTVGNVSVELKVSYVLGRAPQKRRKGNRKAGQRGASCGQGYYPFLRWLGMEEQVSPLVWSQVAAMGMLSGSFAQATEQLREWGVELSEKRVMRLTYSFGRIGIALTEEWMSQLHQGQLPTGETFRGQRVGLEVDGGRTRLRFNKSGKRRASKRRGYYGDWREPKLFTLFAMDEVGKRLSSVELPIVNEGSFTGVEGFMTLLEMYLVKLGVAHAEQVLLIADGASWIWQRIPVLLERLGLPQERLIEVIDFYHASGHLKAFAEAALMKPKLVQEWFSSARSSLKRGKLPRLLKQMQQMMQQKHSKKRIKAMTTAFNYFNDQSHRFDYARVQAMNLPIGSGAIESLIRQVVNLRLKGNGKFWLPEHAEILLQGRCYWAAGQWNSFCNQILTAKLDAKQSEGVEPDVSHLAAA